MLLKNNSTKIIGISETSILPRQTEECPKGYEKNPVIKKYIENGTLSVIPDDKMSASSNATEKETADTAEEKTNLEDMSEEELIRYAAQHNIDIGKASSKEGIIKKIQDAANNG